MSGGKWGMDGTAHNTPLMCPDAPLVGKRLRFFHVILILNANMRRAVAAGISLAFSWAVCPRQALAADRYSWNKVRYLGGTVKVRVDPWDWNATLTINPDAIVLMFSPRAAVRLKPSQVRSISYGPEAHRRVKDIVGAGASVGPPALFGLFRASKEQLIGIVYDTDDGKPGGKLGAVLLESPFHWAILEALKDVTGKPIEVTP